MVPSWRFYRQKPDGNPNGFQSFQAFKTDVVLLFADTELRLSELAGIQKTDINTHNWTIFVWSKGARQRLVVYGEASAKNLQDYMKEGDRGERLFNLLSSGIAQVLGRLEEKTEIKCNAHMFRRICYTINTKWHGYIPRTKPTRSL